MHYEIAGNGTPIILLHGIGSNSRSWRRQMRVFGEMAKAVAWDAPGFGKSEDPDHVRPSMRFYADALRDLLDTLGLHSAVLLGHSLGGVIAQEFYRSYPERVAALILADTSQGGGAESPEIRDRKLANRLHLIRSMTPAQMARQRAPSLLSKHAPDVLVEETVSIMSEVRAPGYEFAARALADADLRGALDRIHVPLLIVWGAEDEITPQWNDWPEAARVEIIPAAGHLCYAEQPDRFNEVVLEFLRTHLNAYAR
jgi:pimeloyl-ACP methyl ester carboxylesterase